MIMQHTSSVRVLCPSFLDVVILVGYIWIPLNTVCFLEGHIFIVFILQIGDVTIDDRAMKNKVALALLVSINRIYFFYKIFVYHLCI